MSDSLLWNITISRSRSSLSLSSTCSKCPWWSSQCSSTRQFRYQICIQYNLKVEINVGDRVESSSAHLPPLWWNRRAECDEERERRRYFIISLIMASCKLNCSASPNSIEFHNVDATWDIGGTEETPPVLKSISARFDHFHVAHISLGWCLSQVMKVFLLVLLVAHLWPLLARSDRARAVSCRQCSVSCWFMRLTCNYTPIVILVYILKRFQEN